jgi:hypothetical protein
MHGIHRLALTRSAWDVDRTTTPAVGPFVGRPTIQRIVAAPGEQRFATHALGLVQQVMGDVVVDGKNLLHDDASVLQSIFFLVRSVKTD